MKTIFEAVDSTEGDTYYPIGIYLTLTDAIADITKGEGNPDFTPPCGDGVWEKEEVSSAEIYERKIGGFGRGIKVWSRTWGQDYSEDLDEYPWAPVTEEQNDE